MKPETDIFFQLPDESDRRVLHPGKMASATASQLACDFQGLPDGAQPEAEVFLFFEQRRQFMQQPARILSVEPSAAIEGGQRVELETTGDPVSAESRDCYRVSAYGAAITAKIGDESGCEVLDVSATGFSVWSTASVEWKLGQTADAQLTFDGDVLKGTICVQSVRRVSASKMRYGVRAVDDARAGHTLKHALNRISLALQRIQAARLSGNR